MASKVLKNTMCYTLAGLIPNLVNFFMLPIYTHFLTPSDYGLVGLVTTATSVIICFLGLQMHNSLARLFFDFEGTKRGQFFSTILASVVVINILILVPMHLLGPWLSPRVFPEVDIPYTPFLFLGLLTICFRSIVNYFMAMLRVLERGKAVLTIAIVNTLLGVGLGLWYVVHLKQGAEGVLRAGVWAAVAQLVMLAWVSRRDFSMPLSLGMIKPALRYSLPIIPHSLGGIIFMSADKYILSYYVPLASIGLYDLGMRFAVVFRMVVIAFSDAISPSFMQESAQSKSDARLKYRQIMQYWAVGMGAIFLGLGMFSEEFIVWLTPESYHGAYPIIPVLLGGFVFRGLYFFAVNALLYEKKTKVIPLVTVSAGIFNIVGNILLIPFWGIMAAAWTSCFSLLLTFVISYYWSRRYYPLDFPWRELFQTFGLAIGLLLLSLTIESASIWIGFSIKLGLFGIFIGAICWLNPGKFIEALKHALHKDPP